jgi:hypothetical protein
MTDPGAATALTIPRLGANARLADALAFDNLRALAIALAQAASGKTWTDYNLHDPGLTLLEAFCFAITEISYRLDFAVADHLCDEDGRIDGRLHGLFAAEQIYPSAAVTELDLRRVILDARSDFADVRLVAHGTVPGLHQLQVLVDPGRTGHGAGKARTSPARSAARGFRANRGLGEDMASLVKPIATLPCWLELDIELTGTRDIADVLADVFAACEDLLVPLPQIADRGGLRAAGASLESLFTGPLTVRGNITPADGAAAADPDESGRVQPPRRHVSASQLRDAVLAVPGIQTVRQIGLRFAELLPCDGIDWAGQLLSWDPAQCVPALCLPTTDDGNALQHVTVRGRSSGLGAGLAETESRIALAKPTRMAAAARFADLRAGRLRPVRSVAAVAAGPGLPTGHYLQPLPYRSIAELLPPLYGLGHDRFGQGGNPASDPSPFAAYIALLDQLLATSGGLVDQIGSLFSTRVREINGDPLPTLWQAELGDAQVPGIESRLAPPVAARAGNPLAVDDPYGRRRQRPLDFLLSLYGEQLEQAPFAPFLDYLDAHELAATLLDNKSTYLAQIDVLTRDRARGFDVGRRLWGPGTAGRTPGFQRRLALKLGFVRWDARRLAHPAGDRAATDRRFKDTDAASGPRWPDTAPTTAAGSGPIFAAVGRGRSLPDLLHAGVDRRRYRWHRGRLGLQLDDSDQLLDLGRYDDAEAAGRAAAALRRALLAETAMSEGLHVVEHILLRPRPECDAANALSLRLTVVMPGWTARTARPDFRAFAQNMIRAECPAHLLVRTLWLDHADMLCFEAAMADWLAALRHHMVTGGEPAACNAAAAELLRQVQPAWTGG